MHSDTDAPGDAPVLDQDKTLERLKGDTEFQALLYKTFAQDLEQRMQRFRDTLAAGDVPSVAKQAHSLKGAAATIDAEALRRAAYALELAAKDGEPDHVRTAFAEVERQKDLLEQALATILSE
jgi:HPt (histidine-containing phosphotransfer) domain-containing protein